jgi:hypothetical protein
MSEVDEYVFYEIEPEIACENCKRIKSRNIIGRLDRKIGDRLILLERNTSGAFLTRDIHEQANQVLEEYLKYRKYLKHVLDGKKNKDDDE